MEPDMEALGRLREPFPPEQIGKLPKGGVTLDFVGHGFLTARFLDVDPLWNWEPLAVDERGLPVFDEHGGLWIKLTIAGITRLGYGDAAGKTGPNAIKEAIGDGLRNAGMRFGAALELWCKGDPDAYRNPEPDPALAAEVAAANEARGELLAKTKQFGWTPETLQKRFFEDYKKNLLATRDVTLIEGFGRILLEELARTPAPQHDPPSDRLTDAQLRKLNTLLSRERLTGHDARVAWCSDALGIPVESTKELTPDQATRLIDKLENTTQEEPK